MRFLPLFSLTVLSSEFSWQMMHLPASNELSIACLESVTDSMSVYYRLLVEPWKDKISVPLAWSGCYDVKYNKNCFTKELCYKFLLKCNKNCFTDSFHEILWHSNTENNTSKTPRKAIDERSKESDGNIRLLLARRHAVHSNHCSEKFSVRALGFLYIVG